MRAWNTPDEYQYDYVQDADPTTETSVEEGESWYDTGAGAAFVYDGAAWVELSVTDHSQLTGVNSDTHHNRYTDSEAASAAPVDDVNGQTGSVSLITGVSDVNGQTGSVSVSTSVSASFFNKTHEGSGTVWYDASGHFVLIAANNYSNGSSVVVEDSAGNQQNIGTNVTAIPDGFETVRVGLTDSGTHVDVQGYDIH